MNSLDKLIIHLKNKGVLRTPELEAAFRKVDRVDFILPETYSARYEDFPLPLFDGQTISQPYTVAFMLDLLNVCKNQSILDIGSGSGWTTALLAFLTGSGGQVLGLERLPNLVKFGRSNLNKYSYVWADIYQAGPDLGNPHESYDRILVSASASHFPKNLPDQLNMHGILVIPVGKSIWKISHTPKGFIKKEYYGFSFVPLVTDDIN